MWNIPWKLFSQRMRWKVFIQGPVCGGDGRFILIYFKLSLFSGLHQVL